MRAEASATAAPLDAVAIGRGAYYTRARDALGPGEQPPLATYRTGAAVRVAVPTNQWYSSVIFERWSQPIHAHPMTYRATEQGFEIGLPEREVASPDPLQREVRYRHVAALSVAPLAFRPEDARLADFSDWLVRLRMAGRGGEWLEATVLHGSPFSYFDCSRGDVRFTLADTPTLLADPRRPGADPRLVALTLRGRGYALFAPSGGRWQWEGERALVLHLPARARYFSVAGLPDSTPATLREFLALAYAFPTRTRVEWRYDPRASTLRSTFRVDTVAREGRNLTTVMGLYPHQWSAARPLLHSSHRYDSVRGPIRLVAGNAFSTEYPFHGVLPGWPGLGDPAQRAAVDALLATDVARSEQLYAPQHGIGTYWIGKGLGAHAQLLSVAEAQGRPEASGALLAQLEQRLEAWFDGRHAGYFLQDAALGTVVGLPQEFHSYQSMNDHHFHYGYWITAAAHVALRDRAWARPEQWGGMVGRLVADIATDQRGRADFPFLRTFDPYEGHSWASGTGTGEAAYDNGNNQESSSEAVNAWAGLILWGEATGNRRLRDLGIYLYTTEIAAVQQYWFDLDHQVLGADYGKPLAVQVFGGKFAFNTWWTEEPRQLYGINLLPLTPASTYLGADPEYLRALFATLPAEEQRYREHGLVPPYPPPADIWQDALAAALALADPAAGRARWNPLGAVESGETRSHTLFWLASLAELGRPDFTLSADTPLYAVFRRADGVRSYLAYNAHDAAQQVTFSDGTQFEVPAHALARRRGDGPG